MDVLRRWRSQHPQVVTVIAWSPHEWPRLDISHTPTFYFLRDGRLVDTVQGWPQQGRRAELLAAARRAGLETAGRGTAPPAN